MSESEVNQTPTPGADAQNSKTEQFARTGAQLAAHRQARGWTIEQVSNHLNLAPRQIQALEEDHYSALPGMVIARGFVRAYAKLLKIDPAPLIAAMQEERGAAPVESLELDRTLSASFTESSLPPSRKSSHGGKAALMLIGLVVTVLAGAWMMYRPDGLSVVSGLKSLTVVADPMVSRQQNAPQSSSVVSEPADSQSSTPILPPGGDAQVSDVPASDAHLAANAADAEAAGIDPQHALVLEFREESWIEIRRGEKGVLVSRLIPAGRTEAFEVRQPSVLVVGNATGVNAVFRGKQLDLKANARTNVARVELN